VKVPEFGSFVFIIPNTYVKNAEDRLVVLNRVASSVIEEVRGEHPDLVFTYRGRPVTKILNSAWKRARERAADQLEADTKEKAPWDFRHVRVHDLRHTFGGKDWRARTDYSAHPCAPPLRGRSGRADTRPIDQNRSRRFCRTRRPSAVLICPGA
jgi:integrase